MRTMQALRAHSRGGPEVLVYEPAPRPVVATGEVLVAVHAAAITFAELTWDLTWMTLEGESRTPTIPSHEISGVVEDIGEGVTDLSIGDEVFGLVPFDRDGGAAEWVTVPSASVARKPVSVSHVVAAAVPLAALTAWQALVDHARVKSGERVLVQGGAGGVGAFVVQVAVSLGAAVTATALSADVDTVRSLGAARVIDVSREDFAAEGQRYDVVIDTVGGSTLDHSFEVLVRGGRLVTLQAPPPQHLADKFGVSAAFFVVRPDRDQLERLAAMVDDGGLQVIIRSTYPLARGREAYESGADGDRSPGKTVLLVR